MLEQLPSPFILLGDMNARNTDWGNPDTNSKGHKIEKLIKDHELCLWNDGNPTFIHPATGSFSATDLSICSPSLFMDFNWVVHDDLCGSDHFPTFLNYDGRPTPEYTPRWNFKKADWDEFKNKCKSELTPAFFETENSNIHMKLFTSTLHDLSVSAIPKTSSVAKKTT